MSLRLRNKVKYILERYAKGYRNMTEDRRNRMLVAFMAEAENNLELVNSAEIEIPEYLTYSGEKEVYSLNSSL